MTTSSVQAAEYRLQRAQEELAEAQRVEAIEQSFTLHASMFAVMARVPEFGQFVSYSQDGELAAVFFSEGEAERYAREMPHPVGKAFVVESIKAFR